MAVIDNTKDFDDIFGGNNKKEVKKQSYFEKKGLGQKNNSKIMQILKILRTGKIDTNGLEKSFDFLKEYNITLNQRSNDERKSISGSKLEKLDLDFKRIYKIAEKQIETLIFIYSIEDIETEGGVPYIKLNEEKYLQMSKDMNLNTELVQIEYQQSILEELNKQKDRFEKMLETNQFPETTNEKEVINNLKTLNGENEEIGKIAKVEKKIEDNRKTFDTKYGSQNNGISFLIVNKFSSEITKFITDNNLQIGINNRIENTKIWVSEQIEEFKDMFEKLPEITTNDETFTISIGKVIDITDKENKEAQAPELKKLQPVITPGL